MATFHAVDPKSAPGDLVAEPRVGVAAERPSAQCEWDLQANTWEWDPDLAVVFGRQMELFIPSASVILQMKHPDDLEMSRSVVNALRSGGS